MQWIEPQQQKCKFVKMSKLTRRLKIELQRRVAAAWLKLGEYRQKRLALESKKRQNRLLLRRESAVFLPKGKEQGPGNQMVCMMIVGRDDFGLLT